MKRSFSILFVSLCAFAFIAFTQGMEDPNPQKSLLESCRNDDWEKVQEIVCHEPELIKTTDGLGRSLLTWAVLKKNKDAVIWLVQRCPDKLVALDKTGRLPIHMAADGGNEEVCRALIVSPQFVTGFANPHKDIVTTLLIHKYCKGGETILFQLPRRLLVACILKPVQREAWTQEALSLHKKRIVVMLLEKSTRKLNASQAAHDKGFNTLVPLLDSANVDQWDEEIEAAYRAAINK